MDYLYIASAIASLLSFIAFLISAIKPKLLPKQAVLYLAIFACITVAFWAWFYFMPTNPVRQRIWERTIAVRLYKDSSTGVGIAEGEFDVKDVGEQTIVLPPFESPPAITLYREKGGDPPQINQVSADAFTILTTWSGQEGQWSFRARGKLLDGRSSN